MIRIAVSSRQGLPPPARLQAEFGPQGGTIGRADTNTLVLDDPDRTVSRVHAQILCRDGRYFIVDRGSNPLHCNGLPLGAGNEVPLEGGERLVIGGFELTVTAQGHALQAQDGAAPLPLTPAAQPAPQASGRSTDVDPFADLLAGLGAPAAAPASPPATPPAAAAQALPDPLGVVDAPGARGGDDPFANLLGPVPTAASSVGSALPPADDFSDLGLPAAASPTASAQRIDELFGGTDAGIGGDPLALSPLADPLLQPNTAARDDPLAAFGEAPAAVQAARSDHLPIGQFGFVPPKVSPVPPPAAGPEAMEPIVGFDDQTGQPIRIARAPRAAQPAAAPLPEAPHALAPGEGAPGAADAFDDLLGGLSPAPAAALDDLLEDVPSAAAAIAAQPIPAAPAPAPAVPSQPLPATHRVAPPQPQPQPQQQQAPVPVPVPVPAVAAPAVPVARQDPAGDAELLAAFLRGLGPVHQAPTVLTPALMERIGSLLRSATEGTLQLLLTRQELKREVRAEVTLIAAQANNPLKFSPTADVALAHLLGPGIRGFMPAEAAMRDAYDDLRAHQFGVMVGMRAALERLIARFEPQELEKKIAARSALDSLFAANRKAKLWDQFHALYQTIASEAEDDFHALFGKAFREAYEAQMARLKGGGPPAS